MNKKIGNISFFDSKQSDYNFTKPYSEATAETIDAEARKLVDDAYERTKNLLLDKRDKLEILANELLKKEIIFQSDLERLIGKRPFDKPTTYEAYTQNGVEEEDKKEEATSGHAKDEEIQEKKEDRAILDLNKEESNSSVSNKEEPLSNIKKDLPIDKSSDGQDKGEHVEDIQKEDRA
jgi:cell division protease FtsH